jgi:peroxiredoxin
VVKLNRELIEQKKFNFEILRDPGNDLAAEYGLRWALPEDLKQLYLKFGVDLAASNGDDSWTLAVPARFVLDSNGVVVSVNADADYTRRPEPQETLEKLRSMAG